MINFLGVSVSVINVEDIYDKNLSFLIGSGASYGLLPTLELKIRGDNGSRETIETLAVKFSNQGNESLLTHLFMYYYKKCIWPASTLNFDDSLNDPVKKEVADNYRKFIINILKIISRKRSNKCCTVFTTNYDGCLALSSEKILMEGKDSFILNDGSSGFMKKYVQAKNYNSTSFRTGIFDRHLTEIPQINLVNLHGSVYWRGEGDSIVVDYRVPNDSEEINCNTHWFNHIASIFEDDKKSISNLPHPKMKTKTRDEFWSSYNKIPIVNPTKWKFHETVFEEHYYQMLRLMSYELERPNSVLISYAFSFCDEHILNIIKRSLSNPSLKMYVCCFNSSEQDQMMNRFSGFKNVECVSLEKDMVFSVFNDEVIFCGDGVMSDSMQGDSA